MLAPVVLEYKRQHGRAALNTGRESMMRSLRSLWSYREAVWNPIDQSQGVELLVKSTFLLARYPEWEANRAVRDAGRNHCGTPAIMGGNVLRFPLTRFPSEVPRCSGSKCGTSLF